VASGFIYIERLIKQAKRYQSTQSGYRPVHNWGAHLTKTVPLWCRDNDNNGKNTDKSIIYMVEAAGIEPATPAFEPNDQRQRKTTKYHKKSKD
jgi:hypothetical protein